MLDEVLPPTPQAQHHLSLVSCSSYPADLKSQPWSLDWGESRLSVIIHGSGTEVFRLSSHRGDLDSDCFSFPRWQEEGFQVVVHTVQRRQAQLLCVSVQKREPESQHGLIFTQDSRKLFFFLHFWMTVCNILLLVFWYLWIWLGPSHASQLNLIFKKCAWVIEPWQPAPKSDTDGKFIYKKITENTSLLIFCMDLSLRIISSLWQGTQWRVFSTNRN